MTEVKNNDIIKKENENEKTVNISAGICTFFSFLRFDLITVSADETETKTQTESNIDFNESSSYSSNLINLYVESDCHSVGAEIDLIVLTSLSNEIVDITFTGNGFVLTDNFEIVDDKIHFSVTHTSANENPQLTVSVLLDNDDTLTGKLFGVVREGRLYVDPYAEFFAERAYQHYTGSIKQENELSSLSLTGSLDAINEEETAEVNATTSEPNTTVTGRILWTDNNGNEQPLRFCRIEVKRIDALINTTLYEGYTNENGEYCIEFNNNAWDGLVNLSINVHTQGTDIEVVDKHNAVYSDSIMGNDLDELNNISTGTYIIPEYIYEQEYSSDEKTFFVRALQIAQAAICASIYYEAMKGSDVANVPVMYPHQEDNLSCFYRNNAIYMLHSMGTGNNIPSYASWDVITHEYGHHVANCEGIDDSPGYWHGGDMAEHYVYHFNNSNLYQDCNNACALKQSDYEYNAFTKEECKYKGCLLSWSEGYATFFGELSQQYFETNYKDNEIWQNNIPTFADEAYTSYDSIISIQLERNFESTESREIGICQILYDLYDSSEINDPEVFDKINLGHEFMWDYIINSQSKTLYQFIEHLKNSDYPKSQFTHLGAILEAHGLATSAPTISSVTSNSPYVEFVWDEPNENGYYNARKFQVNFYDKDYNLIGSTTPQVVNINTQNVGTITIDSQLWQTIINYPSNFYVSITMYECNGNINNSVTNEHTTSYESAYTMYFSPGHVHDYTHLYQKYNSLKHKSYCLCGEFTYENHFFVSGLVHSNCRYCGYVSTSIIPIIKPTAVGLIINNNSDEEN